MIINIQDDLAKIYNLGLLDTLLADRMTGVSILWATDAYADLGSDFNKEKEIKVSLITGDNSAVIKTRARKNLEKQSERTKKHAEVFTPMWIVNLMNNYLDEEWFGRPDVFNKDGKPTERIEFKDSKDWKNYVDSRRLEITCGEAPYLVSRYDVSTGEMVDIKNRIGILDRKLRVVNENAPDEKEWIKWAKRAVEATYGYEFQGDNLLIARINVFMTVYEYFRDRWDKELSKKDCDSLAKKISWNLWQMDGLTNRIPYQGADIYSSQLSMFDLFDMNSYFTAEQKPDEETRCRIYNWRGKQKIEFSILSREDKDMKFDFIIGNPPYQDETVGENKTYAPPIYNLFMDESYKIADAVELIHPARFLFNAGSTPKSWNKKMLSDSHVKVMLYEPDCAKLFPTTDIKGGIAITYRDSKKDIGPIGTFVPYDEINRVMQKIRSTPGFAGMDTIVVTRTAYRFTEKMHNDHPEAIAQLSDGHTNDVSTNIFDRLPQVFYDDCPDDDNDYIQIIGRTGNARCYKYVRRDYIGSVVNLDSYKMFMSKANATGKFGEVLTVPFLGSPGIGSTESFISIGIFDTEEEALNLGKYIKTKFARAMLGTLKITQDVSPEKWVNVPLQDFTPNSDIDWSKSVAEIDQQLYKKYGLDEKEIEFIETHVKEMD